MVYNLDQFRKRNWLYSTSCPQGRGPHHHQNLPAINNIPTVSVLPPGAVALGPVGLFPPQHPVMLLPPPGTADANTFAAWNNTFAPFGASTSSTSSTSSSEAVQAAQPIVAPTVLPKQHQPPGPKDKSKKKSQIVESKQELRKYVPA